MYASYVSIIHIFLVIARGRRLDPPSSHKKVIQLAGLVDINLDGASSLSSFETTKFEIFADQGVFDAQVETRIEAEDRAEMTFLFRKQFYAFGMRDI